MVARVFISGFVQGVRFRDFVKKTAVSLDLTGFVKNLPDTRVEAFFCGDKAVIEKAIGELWKGTYFSDVKNIDVEWTDEAPSFSEFKIEY